MSIAIDEIGLAIKKLEAYQQGAEEKLRAAESIRAVAEDVSRSFSGSWLGYHSRVYYRDFRPPLAGHNFSKEWGMEEHFGQGTYGDWHECAFDDVVNAIYEMAGNPDLADADVYREQGEALFASVIDELEVVLRIVVRDTGDSYASQLLEDVSGKKVVTPGLFLSLVRPKGQVMTRDSLALSQGFLTPPHIKVMSDCFVYRAPHEAISRLLPVIKKAYSYLSRFEKTQAKEALVGTNIFIGHGRSHVWRDLKDFVTERLKLPFDEFNRVPVAGITNIARLAEMLDSAAVAFIVMTAEDEQADGKMEARTNVIHEVGLFQGRLGFTRAIVLLEEGCEEFSNIQGLGQIRFPKGDIKAKFEEIRQVLEREKIIES
ncbi:MULTISPECIES: TIR domain-containing protein [Pseudomonas]|uniref:TIR domain-containing protein n=3 Tax=Pseudomonas TaxID=286 RepID=UPI000CF308EB|nr:MULTISPECIES: TIR domain-containing protein [Pseudomonas]MDF3238103.1 nucleotide-binding protein [Pseudomonas veronii]